MKYKIVTTLGPGGWEKYGRRFAESIRTYWPEATVEIWCHDQPTLPSYDGITFKALEETASFNKLKSVLNGSDGPSLQYSFKAVALAAAVEPTLDWLAFIDADVEFMQSVDTEFLEEVFNPAYDLTYLYRKAVQESEGSWFAFNLTRPSGASLLLDFWGLYDSLEFMHYKKQHDNAVLDRLVAVHRAHGLQVCNLAEGSLGLDAFHQSILGAYAVHYKGPDKMTVADPGLAAPARYDVLCQVVAHAVKQAGPKFTLAEVGTWNGSRAIQMANAAFAAGAEEVCYWGFDTFDQGNDRTYEGHSKPHASLWRVSRRLENYGQTMARLGKKFTSVLKQGNSNSTLQIFTPTVDFAYIDGGHSYETVLNDYTHFKKTPYIVFDDIIKEPEEGAPEGPRRVFAEHVEAQRQTILTPDGYAGLRQTISLGIATRPGLPVPQIRTQIQVKPVDSVAKDDQLAHIVENTAAIRKWVRVVQAHERQALLVSAGPTLSKFLDEIRERQTEGAYVFAVKHAVPTLLKAGILPDYVVVLDPRPLEGVSTHGEKRKDLFMGLDANTPILLATMTNPSVRKELEALGCPLLGWHAHTTTVAQSGLEELKTGLVLNGGTCAAMRLPMLAYTLGFRRFTFYGYDFYYEEGTDPSKVEQGLMQIQFTPTGPTRLTTGELIAAQQDFTMWLRWMLENRLTFDFRGDGAAAEFFHHSVKNYSAPAEWHQWITG
jgi:hypothetical protein